jgi:glucan endo-1,3-alpha-glucosidase
MQVSNAYAAASSMGTTFKLFLSFDMTSLPCAVAADSQLIRMYITTYAAHPNQLLYKGKVFISTFAGQTCMFGTDSVNQGWINTVKTGLVPSTYFVPSFFVDPATFSSYSVLDGAFGVCTIHTSQRKVD